MRAPPEARAHGEAWSYFNQAMPREFFQGTEDSILAVWRAFLLGWQAKGKQNGDLRRRIHR